jgi:hypothetical protein
MRLQNQMRRMRHLSIREQMNLLNQMLRGHYAYYAIAGNIRALQSPSSRGTLLAQNAEQPELERDGLSGAIPTDQRTIPATTAKAVSPLPGAASYRHTGNQLSKSGVR